MPDTTHSDDSLYHRLFSHPEIVADLLSSKPLPSIPEDLEEVVNMLASQVEKWSQEIEQRGLQAGLQLGERKGRQEGEAALLLRLLQRRFVSLPEWVLQKIHDAEPSTLEMWGDRILDAQSLENVFGECN